MHVVSDDERREVAERLRKAIGLTEFAEVLGFDWTDDSDWGWGDVSNLVADLIEPEPERTCRDVGDGGKFVCSKCGASLDYEGRWYEPTYWVDDVAEAVKYCPNCRARVVDE